MQFELILILVFSASCFCATVGEFPFEMMDNADFEDNFTMVDEFVSNFTELENETDLHMEPFSDLQSTEKDQVWTPETSPIFRVIRDFLFQAREGLNEPLDQIAERPMDEKTEHMFKVLEHGLIEATTLLMSQMESSTFPTAPLKEDQSFQTFVKRKGEIATHPAQDEIATVSGAKGKRQTGAEMVPAIASSCTLCYDDLQKCVQKCFSTQNCNDIERSVRECPPAPSRLCNPFTPWSPVDECQKDDDCQSPLLCCNDGCVNKCRPGVWRP